MIALRDYQADGVQALGAALRGGARAVLYVAPTGSGKTRVFAHLAATLTATPSPAGRTRRLLFLVHRRELRAQASQALADIGIEHGTIAPGYPWIARPIQVTSVFALRDRLARLAAWGWTPDWIFIDEAHHAIAGSTWATVLAAWPRARLIGLTATPLRLDGAPLGRAGGGFFDALVCGPSVADLTARGHLAPVECHVPGHLVDAAGVPVRHGEYVRAELAAVCDRPQIIGDAIAHYRALADQRPAIAFCVHIPHAEHVAEEFRRAGYRWAAVYGGMMSRERAQRLAALADGGLHGISTCSLVEEGVDIPCAAVAINLAHTWSLTRRMQRVGRIMRPHPGKGAALELDHVGNSLRHGAPSAPRVWSLDPVEEKPAADPRAVDEPPIRRRERQRGRDAPEVLPGRLVAAEVGADGALRASPRQLAWDLGAMRALERAGGYPAGWADAVHGARLA
jgi:superfamily II DNA or RNA helicase